MATREEIREGAIISLMEYKAYYRAPTEYIIDHIFKYLHSQGVVIRVDGELPNHLCECCEQYDSKAGENYCLKGYCGDYAGDSYKDWKFAGSVAFEPLMES